MNREELIEKVAEALADDWNPDRDPILAAMFRDYAATATDAVLSAVADDLLRIATDDNRVGLYAEAHGVSRAAGYLRSLIEEGKTNDS